MNIWVRNIFILLVIMGSISILGYYANLPQSLEAPPAVPTLPVETVQQDQNLNQENHYRACLKEVETSHSVAWEVNCENIVEGAAQKYNACVAQTAFKKNIKSAPSSCDTNCILPRDIAKKLIQKRDAAKARCVKAMKVKVGN